MKSGIFSIKKFINKNPPILLITFFYWGKDKNHVKAPEFPLGKQQKTRFLPIETTVLPMRLSCILFITAFARGNVLIYSMHTG